MSNDLLSRIAALKAQVDLIDEMERRGIALFARGGSTKRFEGQCPFHDDSTPSLSVYPESQQFHCFGCGAHGDVLDFVQRIEGITLLEALQRLEQGHTIPVPSINRITTKSREASGLPARRKPDSVPEAKEKPLSILSAALSIYREVLAHHPLALSYLAERGITPETRERLSLGYCDGLTLRRVLSGHAQSWRAAQQAGLLTRGGKEWFSGRIIIPEMGRAGTQGYCTWMIGRLLPMLPAREFVIRREQRYLGIKLPKPLLGYTHALEDLRKRRDELAGILVVEGALDYVLARQWDLPVIPVALLSTHPSRTQFEQLLNLQRLSGLPIIDWHDADERGRMGALHLYNLLHGYSRLMLPEMTGIKDLADVAVHPFGSTRLAHAWQGMSDGDPL